MCINVTATNNICNINTLYDKIPIKNSFIHNETSIYLKFISAIIFLRKHADKFLLNTNHYIRYLLGNRTLYSTDS